MKARVTGAILLAAVLGCSLPGTVWAQAQGSAGTPAAAPAADAGGMSDGEKQAVGCGVAATGGMVATYLAGPTEITLLWGGGMLVPANSMTLALSLLGQIGASSCAIGVLATPTVLWFYDQSDNIAAKLADASAGIGTRVLAALGLAPDAARQLADASSSQAR